MLHFENERPTLTTNFDMEQKLDNTTEPQHDAKLPVMRGIFSDSQYDWMMRNLPFRVMYVHRWIDSQHKMWLPRWGYSKRQIADAKKKADELMKGLKWE